MAVAFDAAAASATNPNATSLTFAHTVGGADRVLYVWVGMRTQAIAISSVTYNSVAMSSIKDQNGNDSSRIALYRLIAPDTGTNDVVITVASSAAITGCSMSFTGADQTTPNGTPVGAAGTSDTPTVIVTGTTSGNIVADGIASRCDPNTTATVDGSQTQRGNVVAINTSQQVRAASSTEAAGGDITMSWTLSESEGWGSVGIEVLPVSGGGGGGGPGNYLSYYQRLVVGDN